jgi:hypothetical protein
MLRRLAIAAAVIAVAAAGTGTTVAQPGAGQGGTTEQVTWTINAGQCSQLPAGVSVNGTATKTTTTRSAVNRRGRRVNARTETATGTATDSTGAQYTFDYHFSSITSGRRPPFRGVANDSFDLIAADGKVVVHAFFTANIAVAANGDFSEFTSTYAAGDPLDFATGTPHCDPL